MLEAAVSGAVSFHRVNVLDGTWWRRLWAVFIELERRREVAASASLVTLRASLLANSAIDPQHQPRVAQEARAAWTTLFNACYPWLAEEIDESGAKLRDKMYQQYIAKLGDPEKGDFRTVVEDQMRAMDEIIARGGDLPAEEAWRQQVDAAKDAATTGTKPKPPVIVFD